MIHRRLIFTLGILLTTSFAFADARPKVNYETVQTENGKVLRYRKTDHGYLLVLVPGQEILKSLAAFQSKMGFTLGSATGLGDVEKTQLSHFNLKTKRMDKSPVIAESHEMSSLICTLSTLEKEGAPSPHCHINLGLSPRENFRVVGGHLQSATVSVVAEIMITTYSQKATKTYDDYFQGNLFDLSALDGVRVD